LVAAFFINLRTTSYADGSAIPIVEDNTAWSELEADDKAYCWYDNSSSNEDVYGTLYTWAAATNGGSGNIQGICPDGWHLPSEAEWNELVSHLGGSGEAGYYLKEEGNDHWGGVNAGASRWNLDKIALWSELKKPPGGSSLTIFEWVLTRLAPL